MKIRELTKQIGKIKEVLGVISTYSIIENKVHFLYFIHLKDEEKEPIFLNIEQNKLNIYYDIKRYLFIFYPKIKK